MNQVNREQLAGDVVYLILLNLPVKSLLRFQCVSKSWNEIIASQAFVKSYCISSRSKPRASHLFVHRLWYNCKILYYTKLNDSDASSSCRQLPLHWYEYSDPTRQGGCWFDSSSWDGMLCTPTYETDHTATILVWNPFTRQFRRVPWPVVYTKCSTVRESFVGFGYDHTTDDYKIVVHTYDFSASAYQTYVMTLRSGNNVWRSIGGLSVPWGRRDSKPVTLNNGDVHWISWSSGTMSDNISEEYYWESRNGLWGRFLILKFSFADNHFTIMPSPPKDHDVGSLWWTGQLGEYKGSLCFFNYRTGYQPGAPNTHWIHIRTLLATRDNNGNSKATWVRAINVPFTPLLRNYEIMIPLGFTISGDLMMRIAHPDGRDPSYLIVYIGQENRFVVVPLEDEVQQSGLKTGVKNYHLLQTESLISPN